MTTSTSTPLVTVPRVGPRSGRSRSQRLCGLCRCPGHTRGRCPVIAVTPANWWGLASDPADQMNQQVNEIIRDIGRRSQDGRVPRFMFRDHYLRSNGYNPGDFTQYTRYRYATPSAQAKRLLDHKLRIFYNLRPGESQDRVWELPEEYRTNTSLQGNTEVTAQRNEYVDDTRGRPLRMSDLTSSPTARPTPAPAPAPAPRPTTVPPPVPELVVKDKVIEGTTCPICMEDLTECNKTVVACGHQFHASCMMTWVRQPRSTATTCPTCRAPMFH